MSRTRLILLPSSSEEPPLFMVISPEKTVLQRGALTLDGETPPAMRTVAVVPGAEVLVRWLDLPPGSEAQQRAAALWTLRDDLATTADRVSLTLGPVVPAGERRLVCVVSRALLDAWIAYLDQLGARPDVVLPDMLALPVPEDENTVTAVGFYPNVALRGRGLAVSVQPDMVDLMMEGRQPRVVDRQEDVERLLIAAALDPAIDLTGEVRRAGGTDRVGWKRAAMLAAAVILSPLILTLATAARDDLAASRMNNKARTILQSHLPAVAAAPDPEAELARRLAVAPAAGGAAGVAAALFTAVEGVEGAELDSFTADPADGVRATLSYPAYQDLDAITASLARAGLSLVPASTVDDNGRVVSEVRIGAAA